MYKETLVLNGKIHILQHQLNGQMIIPLQNQNGIELVMIILMEGQKMTTQLLNTVLIKVQDGDYQLKKNYFL